MSVALESDVDLDPESIKSVPTSKLPIMCLREGSPPLPDAYNTSLTGFVSNPISNGSFRDIQGLQNAELCYLMQKNISVKLTPEQINRGPTYFFSGNVSVEGCTSTMLLGQYCNQTVDLLSCNDTYNLTEKLLDSKLYYQTEEDVVFCTNSGGNSCHGIGNPKIFSLDVLGLAEQITIMATNVRFNETASSNGTGNGSGITLMCYARHGTIPVATLHDYSASINEGPLVIRLPRVGRWYIAIHLVYFPKEIVGVQDTNGKVCYSLDWQVLQCPEGKAGLNCTWERYTFQTVLRKNPSVPFESYYLPITARVLSDSANFPLEPLLSNASYDGNSDYVWTYFLLDIPNGASGGNLHIHLTSESKISTEIYAKYGGLPSLDSWDYFYGNTTSNSNGSIYFKLYDSGDEIERCPRRCSSHGTCHSVVDASGLALYSYCFCDRDHGGFDCSVEIVSHQGHMWHSICLIASNAAAVLPAYWSLRQKFMDFWLSFMAVASTFVYLADIGEASKRTIHTIIAIVTALLAETGPTRSTNIVIVLAIGALGLLIGWLIEFCTKFRSLSFSMELRLNIDERWQAIKLWIQNVVKILVKRFRWGFVLAAFTVLAVAAISWTLESSESYWIWHSVWHVTIYASSFLFLCSKATTVADGNQRPPDGNYELTRQDSTSRVGIER
ncbi:transmembrane protein-like protein [Actinidia rufa]|uniref:Transmembrane protein-like protein n=1 Tax=Actinidia rufa TaxID=165716 RepID=A0A7J0H1N1_9ERIC|nr:transmembrane protein-like protein [Actinidia rufa]